MKNRGAPIFVAILLLSITVPASSFITGCLSHSTNSEKVEICTQCGPGYSISADSKVCNTCPFGCRTCALTVCSACSDGYYLFNGQCNSCAAGCTSCDSQYCLGCAQTWFMTSTRQCAKCQQNCQTCSSNNSCQVCNSGFNLYDGRCEVIKATQPKEDLLWLWISLGVICVPLMICCFCAAIADTSRASQNNRPYAQMTPTTGYGNNYGAANTGYNYGGAGVPNTGYNAFAAGGGGMPGQYGAMGGANAGYVPPPPYNKTGGYF